LTCLTIEGSFWSGGLFAEQMEWSIGRAVVLGCAHDYLPVQHALRISFRSRGSCTLKSRWSSFCEFSPWRTGLRASAPGVPACGPPPLANRSADLRLRWGDSPVSFDEISRLRGLLEPRDDNAVVHYKVGEPLKEKVCSELKNET
jgi:hypothetical protein